LSPIRLEHLGEGETFANWNDAASTFVRMASRLSTTRGLWQEISSRLQKRLQKQRMLIRRLEADRAGWQDPGRLRRWGELLLAGLAQARRVEGGVEIPDPYDPNGGWVRVPLDPRFDLARNAERYFQRSRKVEKGVEKIKARISIVKDELAYLETLEMTLDNADGLEDLESLYEELRETGVLISTRAEGSGRSRVTKRVEPRRFMSSGGKVILAGRSARSNEELTFEIARPEDLWFHAADSAGAHVVLRHEVGDQVKHEEIEEAAGIAAHYSKNRSSSFVEVVYTPRKHVRKIRGAPPGTVRLARYQSVRVRPALLQTSVIGHRSSDDEEH
jgi:predicted ribosome quality control (RQC) complex YloA/Tae2 family protein